MTACSLGHLEIASLIVDLVNNINVGDIVSLLSPLTSPFDLPQEGCTALMIACSNGFLDIATLLISKGANVNCQNIVVYLLLHSSPFSLNRSPERIHDSRLH
jgi:ankyrin repeat protein